jgi:hypothetical protein
MAPVSIAEFAGDTIVVHFGGPGGRIRAYTLAQSLSGFADTARAISAVVDPGHDIEIWVEATGPGSFRTVIQRRGKEIKGIFTEGAKAVFWGVVAAVIFEYSPLKPHEVPPQMIVQDSEVVVTYGDTKVVVPRHIHDAAQNLKDDPNITGSLRRTFEPLQKDEHVTEFGLTKSLFDPRPMIVIPRHEFSRFTHDKVVQVSQDSRIVTKSARLLILKAWLNHAKRKWSFEWNGVPISAPITDQKFLDELERREHLIGAGDALDVEISVTQNFDPKLGVFVNDPNSFKVTRVIHHIIKEGS